MNTHPRAYPIARRSGRLSDPKGSRPVTACASVSLARLIGATPFPCGQTDVFSRAAVFLLV